MFVQDLLVLLCRQTKFSIIDTEMINVQTLFKSCPAGEIEMKITDSIYMVGSGRNGFSISHSIDCHVYLLEGADEHILIDAGAGLDAIRIIENIEHEDIDPCAIRHLILTHTHSDHSGGAAYLREQLGLTVHVPRAEAEYLQIGDGDTLGLQQAIADGIYPPDYRFIPCDVDTEVRDGDIIEAGASRFRRFTHPAIPPAQPVIS